MTILPQNYLMTHGHFKKCLTRNCSKTIREIMQMMPEAPPLTYSEDQYEYQKCHFR